MDTLSISKVTLTVNALDRVSRFYQDVVGLRLINTDSSTALLGVRDDVLLELRQDRAARLRTPQEAGLFHTAFLLPSRADLGAWLKHATAHSIRLDGASDHAVSEAIYLSDPEGNGIEIYTDRPKAQWQWENGLVHMTSERLDIPDLVKSADDKNWAGFPDGATIGHVHLQVGNIAAAEEFYNGTIGLDITCRYPGATFYSAGGYHHHIATNIWNSRAAPARTYPSTGLAEVQLTTADTIASNTLLQDPWGTQIRLNWAA